MFGSIFQAVPFAMSIRAMSIHAMFQMPSYLLDPDALMLCI